MDKDIMIKVGERDLTEYEHGEGLWDYEVRELIDKIEEQANNSKEALSLITGLYNQLSDKDKLIKEQAEEIKKLKEQRDELLDLWVND